MRKIIIIGTLHCGSTPNHELEEILNKYKPDQLLVELKQAQIAAGNVDPSFPPEMIFAYEWAKHRGVPVAGFESDIRVFSKTASDADNQKLIEAQDEIIKTRSWKDFNKKDVQKLLDIGDPGMVDPVKVKAREQDMLKRVNEYMIGDGVIIILIGSGHLEFFEKHLPRGVFPFR